MRVRRHVVPVLLYPWSSSNEVCRFADGGHHIILLGALDGVVGAVVFHSTFEIRGHHAHRYRTIILVPAAVTTYPGHVNSTRGVQCSQHTICVRKR